MFETIVVGIDGRPHDREAIALAQHLADPGADIIIASVAVIDEGLTVPSNLGGGSDVISHLEDRVDEVTEAHPEFQGVVTNATSIGEGLRELARGANADLIVVASSSRGLVGRIFAGDAVRDVLRQAPCPVAVTPVGYEAKGAKLTKVVVGYDATPAADAAVVAAIAMRERDGAEVQVIEVIEPFPVVAGIGGYAGTALGDDYRLARARLDRLSVRHGLTGDIVTGSAARELARAGRNADLITIGLEDRSLLDRVLIGSTAHALLREQSAPLLVVPPRHHADGVAGTPTETDSQTVSGPGSANDAPAPE